MRVLGGGFGGLGLRIAGVLSSSSVSSGSGVAFGGSALEFTQSIASVAYLER